MTAVRTRLPFSSFFVYGISWRIFIISTSCVLIMSAYGKNMRSALVAVNILYLFVGAVAKYLKSL